jgi:threonine synthase
VLYLSTRGEAPLVSFSDALLAGLARDGGLYLPETWPTLAREDIAAFKGKSYPEVALEVIRLFLAGSIKDADLERMIGEAYAGFGHPAVAPLKEIARDEWILELFHGPTLAFKDIAMQLLARLMDHVLAERNERATIVVATSGDTGGAAVEAFRGRDRVDLIILYPEGRVSEVQRQMMTTALEENVHAVAIAGTFDDCQAIVKALFNDHVFRDRIKLSAANSINWARIAAQSVYYFTAAAALGAPAVKVRFAVPTGNFGDIFAGYAASRMGLPLERLLIATNVNDILARTLATGRYEPHQVVATASPAMDIQVSSNFERLLFEASGRDPKSVRALMTALAKDAGFALPAEALAAIRASFEAGRADEAETVAMIRAVHAATGYQLDPHTAVALAVARKLKPKGAGPTIVLGTAHPAKFPQAVEAATGVRPQLPARLADLGARRERIVTLPASSEAVARFVEGQSRAAVAGAAA